MAVATPCWPAPVSAMSRCLPMRRASRAWPTTLLSLCEPVWARSSRLSRTRTPRRSDRRRALGHRRRPPAVVAQDVVELACGRPGRPRRRRRRPRAPCTPAPATRGRSGRRTRRSGPVLSGTPMTAPLTAPPASRRSPAPALPSSVRRRPRARSVVGAGRALAAACERPRSRGPCGGPSRPGRTRPPRRRRPRTGRRKAMASATFPSCRPPETMSRLGSTTPSASRQSNTSPEPGEAASTRT